ncbi:MAG: pyridoxine 5'-phosphate synthase [Muribaculaceae bacterium]|nr:pyridoxine 5'-phosphate synthase [Muribaculaceae bacterium]
MTRLSVNINKVATLRNARGENNPDLVAFALHCEKIGAQGITVHPRPDERHIRRSDVYDLKSVIATEFNIEGYPSEDFLRLVEDVRPAQATLVPDRPEQLTSSSGWDVAPNADFLRSVVDRLHKAGVRVSIFIAADPAQVKAAKEVGADRVELYTKPYADAYADNPAAAIAPFVEASLTAREIGVGMNAGHDLSLQNLEYFNRNMPHLQEVSIGHALICDAIYLGIDETIRRYRECLAPAD